MNGIICINKPQEFTSFDVIAKVRGIIGERKMGHAGTLDPMATGVLPIFMGGATKAIGMMDDHTKEYRATFKLGITTDTEDIWGNILTTKPFNVCKDDVLYTLNSFKGVISQVPPMYSAVQVNGQRLYDLARQGIEIERKPREVEIFLLELVSCDENKGEYTVDVVCSKGTYIRTLCSDIGNKLGCGAVMTALERTRSCGFTLADCVTIEELQKIRNEGGEFPVIPTERAFSDYPKLTVTSGQARRFSNGAPLSADRLTSPPMGKCAVFSPDGIFLGIGDNRDGELKVAKLFIIREDTFNR